MSHESYPANDPHGCTCLCDYCKVVFTSIKPNRINLAREMAEIEYSEKLYNAKRQVKRIRGG